MKATLAVLGTVGLVVATMLVVSTVAKRDSVSPLGGAARKVLSGV